MTARLSIALALEPPATDAEFLAACARIGGALALLAGQVGRWAGGVLALGPPAAALAPLSLVADGLAGAAASAALAAAAFEDEFASARDVASRGLALTGHNEAAPGPSGHGGAAGGITRPATGTPPSGADSTDHPVERWPIEKAGAMRSGNNPEMTVEEEHQMRMAGQGNPHRNDARRARKSGFPDAFAYQQHITDSMREHGMVNPVEYRQENDHGEAGHTGLVMTTGHHRYSGARVLGWTHIDIRRQGPYGSQNEPVPGFDRR